MAGIVGVHAGPFTMRQLAWMSEGKQAEAWNHTATLQACVMNLFSRHPVQPTKLHPFHRRRSVGAKIKRQRQPARALDGLAMALLKL